MVGQALGVVLRLAEQDGRCGSCNA